MARWSPFFVSVIGSTISEISQFTFLLKIVRSGSAAVATYKLYNNFLGPLCQIYTPTFSELTEHSRKILKSSFGAFFCCKKKS